MKKAGVVHDSKSFKTDVSLCACHTKKGMHSRDITVLINLLWCTTPACFSTFLTYSSLKFLIFEYSCLLTFLETVIMTGEPTSKALCTPIYQLSSEK